MMIRQIAPQERQVHLAPLGNQLIVVAVADRAAHHKQQHLRQRMRNPPRLARVLDPGENDREVLSVAASQASQ